MINEGIMNLRLIAIVTDDQCWNGVIFFWIDLPSQCIRVNAAVHEEPRIVQFRRIEILVIH